MEPDARLVVDRKTVQEAVYSRLRDLILRQVLKPGQRLRHRETSDQLGVSAMPVREALHRLEAEGLVTIHPHRGAIVARPSAAEVEEIYLMRGALEGMLAKDAAPRMTEATLARLRELLAKMEQATAAADNEALLHLNREFHFAIYSASSYQLIHRVSSSMWDRCDGFRRAYLLHLHRAERALEEHRQLLFACEQHDGELAALLSRKHIEQTAQALLRDLRAEAEAPPDAKKHAASAKAKGQQP